MPTISHPDRAIESYLRVSTDPNRKVTIGLRESSHRRVTRRVDRKIIGDVVVGPEPSQHGDTFVGARPSLGERNAECFEFSLEPSRSKAENHASVAQSIDRGDRFRRDERMAHRKNENGRSESDARCRRCRPGESDEGFVDPWRWGIRRSGRHRKMVADPHVGVTQFFGEVGGSLDGDTRGRRSGLGEMNPGGDGARPSHDGDRSRAFR